jgi:predicted Zn finger-like uncharacterized protein
MIIQCDKCQTKFRLDDSKVKDTGVKVRCVKCRNVFMVTRDVPELEQRADFGEMFDDSLASGAETTAFQDETEQVFEAPAPEETPEFKIEESAPEASFEDTVEFDAPAFSLPPDESDDMFAEAISADQTAAVPQQPEGIEFGEGQMPAKAEPDEIDFGGFDFGDAAVAVDENESSATSFDFGSAAVEKPQPVAAVKKEYGGLDFSDDDMFGEVVPQAPEEPTTAISFDLGMDGFADAMRKDDGFGGQKASFGGSEMATDAPFSLDEIDFGDDLTAVAIQQINPEELKPSQEILFGPLAEAQARIKADHQISGEEFFGAAQAVQQQELPPLPIASRRKQGPFNFKMFAAAAAVVIAALGIYGYKASNSDNATSTQESGKITVSDVNATFVKNKSTGDLLVITGEAVNEYDKPRAAIQIKGMVYGADGQVIASKNAFCGNPLTPKQLETMSQDKIEAAMANQFGDSLANMEVAPGKAIQFVIVMAKPDKAAKDYGVEAAGSTVAAGKQQ